MRVLCCPWALDQWADEAAPYQRLPRHRRKRKSGYLKKNFMTFTQNALFTFIQVPGHNLPFSCQRKFHRLYKLNQRFLANLTVIVKGICAFY